MKNSMEIAVDFDGTCVTYEFPKVGKNIGAEIVLKKLTNEGHKLILFTMRSDRHATKETGHPDIQDVTGMFLQDAIDWFKSHDIPLYGVQANPTQKDWTTSPKCYAQLYIDDATLGCPLVYDDHDRPYVCWKSIETILTDMKLIK